MSGKIDENDEMELSADFLERFFAMRCKQLLNREGKRENCKFAMQKTPDVGFVSLSISCKLCCHD